MQAEPLRRITPWWRTIRAVVSFERRIAMRTWRFWLLFGLLFGVAYLAWRDYSAAVEHDLFVDPALAFMHPGVGIVILILMFGSILLGTDASARLDRTRVASVLYTRPMGTVAFIWGRYLAVLCVLVPLSALGWFILPVVLLRIDHAGVIWQPFIVVYFGLLFPVLLVGTAIGMWMRIVTGRDVAAVLLTLVLLVLFFVGMTAVAGRAMLPEIAGGSFSLVMRPRSSSGGQQSFWLEQTRWHRYSMRSPLPSPGLGIGIPLKYLVVSGAYSGLAALAFLVASPLHLRRQEPQRSIIRRRERWYRLTTFRRWIGSLRFDRELGWIPKSIAVLVLAAILSGFGYRLAESLTKPAPDHERHKLLVKQMRDGPRRDLADILGYDLAISVDAFHSRISVEGSMTLRADGADLSEIRLRLPDHFSAARIEVAGVSSTVEPPALSLRVLHVDPPVPDGGEAEIQFAYEGELQTPIVPKAGQLSGHVRWYPTLYEMPEERSRRARSLAQSRSVDVFDAKVRIRGLDEPGTTVVLAGQDVRQTAGSEWTTLGTSHPTDNLSLIWARFIAIEDQFGPTPVTFLALEEHEYQANVYLAEVRDQQERILAKMGPLRLPRMLFVERPGWFGPGQGDQTGGVIFISENDLVYLHEGIWDLERYDTNPLEVPFYATLRNVLWDIRWSFSHHYISIYFRGQYEAGGSLGFWISEYLPTYVRKAMETNRWRRRSELHFTAGERFSRQMVALPLEELHTNRLSANRAESNRAPEIERIRAEGLWRTLHHCLGDRAWWRFVRELLRRHHLQLVTAEDVRRLAEEISERDFEDFFQEWVYGDALPMYEITEAKAVIVEDPDSLLAKYRCKVHVRNRGTGRIDVPILIKTELDEMQRLVWIDSGGEADWEFEVSHRPILVAVDPSYWLLQEVYRVEGKRALGTHELRFEIVQSEREIPTVSLDSI